MRYEINLKERPSVIYITVESNTPKRLSFIGYNSDKNNTTYFSRSKEISGVQVVEIPMPLTPNVLTIDISQEDGKFGSFIKVLKIYVTDMPSKTTSFPKNTLEFYNFMKVVAERTGYLKSGFYVSKDENFVIWVKDHLDGDSTPARVNRRTGVTKWNLSKMKDYTVFMRVFIGLHEFFHYALQTTNEIAADTGALKVYLAMGFPKSEANYAMTKIFDSSPEAIERVKVMDNIIKQHDRQTKSQVSKR